MANLFGISISFLLFVNAANGAKILGICHMPAYSHHQLGNKIFKELAAKGHEVTVITPFEEKKPLKNFKQVILTGALDESKTMKGKLFEQTESSIMDSVLWLESLGYDLTEKTLSHPNVQSLLNNSSQTFDLVIIEQILSDAFKGFCHHYKAICVVLSPILVPHWTHAQVANPDSPAYIPDMYSTLTFDSLSFRQRFINTVIYVGLRLFYRFYAIPRQNQLLQKYFSNPPHLFELYYNTSLVLINSHVSINSAQPFLPNVIEIGGYHIETPKRLPRDFQEYLDESKDGAILFSLGSTLQSKDLPEDKREAILKAFSKLKQKVLWKWEEESMVNQPKNVKLSKWLPQADILAHPNLKLLISHGGFLSTTEAVYHGVPIIGIPIFSDQGRNIAVAEKADFAISVPYKDLSEEKLSNALDEILNNPKYSENAKRRSEIMHDEPMKQLDKAVFWIEYVIRHKGAPHLRSAALNLHFYQYLLLDVVALVALVVFIVFLTIYVVLKRYCGTFKRRQRQMSIKKINRTIKTD